MAKGETYEQFVEKFKPKKTTDDCYTPPLVYEAVKGWACREYGIDPARVVRPFWPGGDYERFEYQEGCAVIDNPPFSILSAICVFYIDRDVPFFLFAPSLTCLGGAGVCMRMNHLITEGHTANVVKLPLDPPHTISLGIALPSGELSPAAQAFVDMTCEMLAEK